MKKIIQILTAAVVSTAFIGTVAGAATCNGTITLTGPDSNNTIACNEVDNINVSCFNNAYIGNANYQTGTSGSASGNNNTSGGNVATGTVVNDNGTNVTIGTSCGTLAAAGGGGGGGGAPAADVPSGAGGIGELPNTANTPAIVSIAYIVAIATGVAFAVRLAAYATSRYLIDKSIKK